MQGGELGNEVTVVRMPEGAPVDRGMSSRLCARRWAERSCDIGWCAGWLGDVLA